MKFDFREHYQGPDGPHLDHLTGYSRYRNEQKRIESGHSIHRHNWPITGSKKKRNTMRSTRPETIQRKVDAIRNHLLRHPDDTQSQTRLAKLESQQ